MTSVESTVVLHVYFTLSHCFDSEIHQKQLVSSWAETKVEMLRVSQIRDFIIYQLYSFSRYSVEINGVLGFWGARYLLG